MNVLGKVIEEGVAEQLYGSAYFSFFDGEKVLIECGKGGGTASSLFDVASITKLFTALVCSLLGDEGIFSVEDPLQDFSFLSLPPDKQKITLKMLLSHTAGFPSYYPFYKSFLGKKGDIRNEIIQEILETPLLSSPGEEIRYSDLGYILLGYIMEEIMGKKLSRLLEDAVTFPLGLHDTFYSPLSECPDCDQGRIISTGFCPLRKREKVGEVDDLNSFVMGGVAGHAGIFSTAFDLIRVSREIFLAGRGKGHILGRGSIAFLLSPVTDRRGSVRMVGFDAPSGATSLAGKGFSDRAGGHLGFTGVSLWIDFRRERGMVFLTNRTYFNGNREKFNEIRRRVHDRAWEICPP